MSKFFAVLFAAAMFESSAAYAQTSEVPSDANIVAEIREGPCVMILEKIAGPDKGGFGYSDVGAVQVLRDTQKGLLDLEAHKDSKIVSILCVRSTPIPFPLDYRVILSGYDFLTTSSDKNREFSTTLTKENGVYVHIMKTGSLTEAEQEIVDGMVRQFLEDEKAFLAMISVE